ncbi:hypothetical protein [Actomonas aquatica]|uniref:EF-hand domain-containing protein n=1 Tax=Actomonas aquatica TaxID=2866162 RepID=A0ABZ1CED2_9BACT|nr:hypothetical protein [Opitutus sp. WL0086]WRQ90025.1 hypothetical protein K1X11_011455 [Opitutus sp. WL0086]
MPPPPPPPPHRGHPLMLVFDADGDGILSAVEIAAAPSVLQGLDTDHDGLLVEEELMAVLPPPRPPRHR